VARRTISSWSMVILLGLTGLFSTCDDVDSPVKDPPVDEWRDKNRPATFFDTCDPAAPKCKSPFSCLHNPELTGPGYCTQACTSDSDCPRWTATGHCAGPFQSRCGQGVCQYGCE
jgi:hypothetical protein